MSNRRKGFTLTELLVVMAIMVLFIALASATLRALGGGRSISTAQNELASILNRAREDAIAVQSIRGVLFYLDPSTNQVATIIVQLATIQDSRYPNYKLLDQVPGRESVLLPQGVGLQTIFNGTSTSLTAYTNNGSDDRYLGFNVVPASNANTFSVGIVPIRVGGCILFDSNGRVISIPYGLQWYTPKSSPNNVDDTVIPTNIAATLGIGDASTVPATWNGPSAITGFPAAIILGCTNSGPGAYPFPSFPLNLPPTSAAYIPGTQMYGTTASIAHMRTSGTYQGNGVTTGYPGQVPPGYTAAGAPGGPGVPVLSQLGLVLFDRNLFLAQGFNDDDADINNQAYTAIWAPPVMSTRKESDEETWLDENSTPVILNRYDGTLIKSE